MSRKKFICGNWKMHKTVAEATTLARDLRGLLAQFRDKIEIGVAPAATAVHAVAKALEDSNVFVLGQNCHWEKQGAFTGEVSAAMLGEAGAKYVILGHSERRQHFGETDETVNKRLKSVLEASLGAIVCVGETLRERDSSQTLEVVTRQLKVGCANIETSSSRLVIAYEPVWAIGTGKTATPKQAQEVHAHIRKVLSEMFKAQAQEIRIQYGGSVKPDNAQELMSQPDIDGALVGGASLVAQDFASIVRAAN